jgi:hypothetical protein
MRTAELKYLSLPRISDEFASAKVIFSRVILLTDKHLKSKVRIDYYNL